MNKLKEAIQFFQLDKQGETQLNNVVSWLPEAVGDTLAACAWGLYVGMSRFD